MAQKDRIDAFGATALVLFSALLGFNQVVIKVVNEGLQPVFFAGLRSAGAVVCVGLWMWARGYPIRPGPGTWRMGLLIGLVFSLEFLLLFVALDLTTVSRTSVIFYSMPLWMALGAHFLDAGDRITPAKAAGLGLSFAGVAWAILDRPSAGEASLAGDLAALCAALCWAAAGLIAKTSALRRERPEMQLMWQIVISAVVLTIAAPLFGPLVRELAPIHLWGLAFQIVVVVSAGFVFWFWLLSIYPASGVAAFGFLGPIFGVGFGWLILGERVGSQLLGALALVAAGLWLMNRPRAG